MSGPSSGLERQVFSGFSEVLHLSGFSGANVALLRTFGGKRLVRKAARTPDENAKLRRQASRQRWLGDVIASRASVPAILSDGEIEGLYYFDMPFIASRDAVSFLSTATFDELGEFALRVEELVAALAAARPEPGASARLPTTSVFIEKLFEIDQRTQGHYRDILGPLQRAAEIRGNAPSPALCVPTAFHGDLTFENILVGRKGQLWLIDPIDSPFDHYWIDWSKLFQECEGRWHAHRGRPIATSVTWWLRNKWMAAAARSAPEYPSWHYLLLGLTFARILPYARSSEDREFVARRVAAYGDAALALV